MAVVGLIALVAAACSDSSSSDSETTTTTAAPSQSTTTTTGGADSSSAATIEASNVGAQATPYATQQVYEGDISVYFNNGSNGSNGTIIAIYFGPGTSDPTGLCPGNSLNDGTFKFVSNAPAAEGACEGFPTDRGSVRVCTSGVWLYETMIPNDSAGDLYGSIEASVDGEIAGSTAVATNVPGTPEIDYSADTYTIDPMFTSDGATEITCGDAMT